MATETDSDWMTEMIYAIFKSSQISSTILDFRLIKLFQYEIRADDFKIILSFYETNIIYTIRHYMQVYSLLEQTI